MADQTEFDQLRSRQLADLLVQGNTNEEELLALQEEAAQPQETDFGKEFGRLLGAAIPAALLGLAGGGGAAGAGLIAGGESIERARKVDLLREDKATKLINAKIKSKEKTRFNLLEEIQEVKQIPLELGKFAAKEEIKGKGQVKVAKEKDRLGLGKSESVLDQELSPIIKAQFEKATGFAGINTFRDAMIMGPQAREIGRNQRLFVNLEKGFQEDLVNATRKFRASKIPGTHIVKGFNPPPEATAAVRDMLSAADMTKTLTEDFRALIKENGTFSLATLPNGAALDARMTQLQTKITMGLAGGSLAKLSENDIKMLEGIVGRIDGFRGLTTYDKTAIIRLNGILADLKDSSKGVATVNGYVIDQFPSELDLSNYEAETEENIQALLGGLDPRKILGQTSLPGVSQQPQLPQQPTGNPALDELRRRTGANNGR